MELALCFFPFFMFTLQPKLTKMNFEINLRTGQKLQYSGPQVMGIINITPDSFFAGSRTMSEDALRQRVKSMVQAGATMFDVGACSTRPGGEVASAEEELRRLEWGLPLVISAIHDARCTHHCEGCTVDQNPFPVSVDTFRASVAEVAVTRLGADIINDVYGGEADANMLSVVNKLGAPYILTAPVADVPAFFNRVMAQIHGAQVILDPGFGFGKDLEQNYDVFRSLQQLIASYPANPMLVGISRKSMIWRLLGTTPEHALNGTTVLNTLAIMAGAHILRVHDVQECAEAVKICQACRF